MIVFFCSVSVTLFPWADGDLMWVVIAPRSLPDLSVGVQVGQMVGVMG